MVPVYDIVIIGCGIGGLYSAYLYKKLYPHKSICIFEKTNYIGGRVKTKLFSGTKIVQGAGVGRLSKDKNLIQLLKDLKIPYQTHPMTIKYSLYNPTEIERIHVMVEKLKQSIKTIKAPISFKEYASLIIGPKDYDSFVNIIGYTDFENTDAFYTLKHYGLDDVYNNKSNSKIFLDWDILIGKLVEFIGKDNIHTNICIEKIDADKKEVFLSNLPKIKARDRIVIATPITSIRKLLQSGAYKSTYDIVEGQPFMYVYAKLSHDSTLKEFVTSYSVIDPPLRKIIPFDLENNVFMIAYVDNEDAKGLLRKGNNKTYFENEIRKSYPNSIVKIEKIWRKYWKIGTHYFKPFYPTQSVKEMIYQLQHPHRNVLVVGEAVSMHQGWVEGALQSARSVIH